MSVGISPNRGFNLAPIPVLLLTIRVGSVSSNLNIFRTLTAVIVPFSTTVSYIGVVLPNPGEVTTESSGDPSAPVTTTGGTSTNTLPDVLIPGSIIGSVGRYPRPPAST